MSDDQLREAESLFSRGQAEEARERVYNVLESDPASLRAWNDLGTIQQTLGDSLAAVIAFRKALELAPENEPAQNGLAVCLISLKQWAEAREVLQSLVAGRSDDPKLWALLGQVEKELNLWPQAAEAFDKSLALNPAQPGLRAARDRLGPHLDEPGFSALELLMCCQDGVTHFAFQLCDELEKQLRVTRVTGSSFTAFQPAIAQAPIVWLEWGTALAAQASRTPGLLDGRRAIVRLHSFEILTRIADQINYSQINDVIFVSHYMKQLFLKQWPEAAARSRLHVIHNGISLDNFPFVPGKGRSKIALVGRLDYKKDPMVMMQAFAFLRRSHPELELHVAGHMDQDRYCLALPDMVAKNGLERAVKFYGHVADIPGWLADKDMIICTSPFESQGVGILEAAHSGLKPLIYNFPGAEQLYPASWLWNNFDELEQLVLAHSEPAACRDFVAEHYSMARQARSFLRLLTSSEPVVEPRPMG